jgi:PiT family inorganic phosphate transporter
LPELTAYIDLLPGLALCVILGANNLSTCIGTSMAARALRYPRALALASLGLMTGIVLEGSKLSKAIGSGIVATTDSRFALAVAVSTFIIMAFLTYRRLPISLSQVAVGAAIGSALAYGMSVDWWYTLTVASSWVFTPFLGLVISMLLSLLTKSLAKKAKGVFTLNRLYAYLTIFSGVYASYVLGANTVGLLIGMVDTQAMSNFAVSVVFGVATIAGMVLFSRGTTRSVAENIVGLSPSASFASQLGGAITVHGFTEFGIPVSVSQAVVGGIFGAAIPRKIVVRNDRLTREIIVGWTLAPLLGAVLAFLLSSAL